MNAKQAKKLRKIIESNPDVKQTDMVYFEKNKQTGELKWNRTCFRGMYRELKKQIRLGNVQL